MTGLELDAPRPTDLLGDLVPGGFVFDTDPVRVVGLDLSLTSTGYSDGRTHGVVSTRPDEQLEARLDRIIRTVVQFILTDSQPDLVVIEAPAFSRQGPGHDELSALRIMIRYRLWRLKIPYALVPPTTLKKYITGDGAAVKSEMAACLATQYGWDFQDVKVSHGRYDMADGFSLAAMGYDRLGQPIGNAAYRASLDAVKWPELLRD